MYKSMIILMAVLFCSGCYTSTKLVCGDLTFSRFDMGWQGIDIRNTEFVATNGTHIIITGYSKDNKDTTDAVKKLTEVVGELAKIVGPLVLAQQATIKK